MDEKYEPHVKVIAGQGGKDGRGGDVKLSTGAMSEVFDVVVQKLREGLVAGSGGNTLIASGSGSGAPAGDIIFNVGSLEVLRIDPRGDFFYKGEKLDHNEDVAVVLRGWLGYCLVVMNRESRVRFEGEERIAELEAQLRECRKSSQVAIEVEAQTLKRAVMAWRDWAQQVIGVALVDPEASRAHIDKLIAKLRVEDAAKLSERRGRVRFEGEERIAELEAQLKVVAEERDEAWNSDSWLRPRTDRGRVDESAPTASLTHGACVLVVKRHTRSSLPLVLAIEGPKGTGLPGGSIEPGEQAQVAAMRELLEETGLALKAGAVVFALPERPTDNGVITHGFVVDAMDTLGELRASKEGRPVWLRAEDLAHDRPGHPPVRFPKYNEWILNIMNVEPFNSRDM